MATDHSEAATGEPRLSQRAERGWLLAAQEVAARFYRAQLGTGDGAGPAGFLARLGVPVDGAWVIGFAPDRPTALVSELRSWRFSDLEILASGLARTTSRGQLIDLFRNRVMVGIRDGSTRETPVVGFVGYASPPRSPGVPARVYSSCVAIHRPHSTLFGVEEQRGRAGRRPILAAHPLDAIVLSERTANASSPPLVVAPAGHRLTRRHVTVLGEVADLSAGVGIALHSSDEGRGVAEYAFRVLAPVVGEHNVLIASWATGLEDTRRLAEALGIAPAEPTAETSTTDVAPRVARRDEPTRPQVRITPDRSPTDRAEQLSLDFAGEPETDNAESLPPSRLEEGRGSDDMQPLGTEVAADADNQPGAASETNAHSLPDKARPVPGVAGYHYTYDARLITVYGPGNAPIAIAKRGRGELSAGEVDGVRIPGSAYGPDEFAPLAARQHRTAALTPELRDRVSVELVPDSAAKAGYVVAVRGIVEGDLRDRAAIDGVVTFRWSRKHNAFATGRAWNRETVDSGLAYLLTTFGRQGRNVLVTQAGVERDQDPAGAPATAPTARRDTPQEAAAAADRQAPTLKETHDSAARRVAVSDGTTESAAPFSPVEAARIRVAVEDHAARYFGGPLGLARDDAARYVSEGHLKSLVDKYGLREVWDGVAAELEARPELLERDEAARAASRAARHERAAATSRDALAAYKTGDVDGALKALDAGELIDPEYRYRGVSWDRARELIGRHQQKATIAAIEASDTQPEQQSRRTMSNLRDTLIARFGLRERTDNYADRPHADLWEGSGVNPSISDRDEGMRRLEGMLPAEADWPEQWADYPYRVVWRIPSERMHVTHCEGDVSVLVARTEDDFAAIDASADRFYGSRETAPEQGSEAIEAAQTTHEADGPEATAAQPVAERSDAGMDFV